MIRPFVHLDNMMKYREGVKITNRNNALAEIISKVGDLYKVRVRGSPDTDEENSSLEVKKKHLHFLSDDYEENMRKGLFKQHSSALGNAKAEIKDDDEDDEIREQVFGFLLGDECGYLIWKHSNPNNLDGLPKEIEERVVTLLIEQYYILGGQLATGGRNLTSYCKALSPFLIVKEETVTGTRREANFQSGTPNTGKEIVSWFESLVLAKSPSKSASLFFRAFAFGQFLMDNRSSDDSLLAAFYVVFSAIQMITGKGSSHKMQSCQKEIQESIEAAFQTYGTEFQTKLKGKKKMSCRHLLWCLCRLFLDLGLVVRDKIPEKDYDMLLPNPYGDTVNEQLNIANLCMECREDHPSSFYAAHQMIMDVKDLVSPSVRNNLLADALKVARKGKAVAFEKSNSYYSFVFLLIESFWIPTSLWPQTDAVTYKCIKERLSQAQKFKEQCQDYTSEQRLKHASANKHQLMAFLKSAAKTSSISICEDNFLISSIQFEPYAYCSFRFANTPYYKLGGKFDRLATCYKCSYCSKTVSTIQHCSRCGKENYCNRDCQKKHWKNGHKKDCKSLQSPDRK
jgi:hypothetical protein